MYVCVCKAVKVGEVEAAIEGGASSVAEVTKVCRAGGDCGACHALIDQMIDRNCDRSGPIPAIRLVRRPRAA
jgi:assimilatory nitrate reductase electron transfer subunit